MKIPKPTEQDKEYFRAIVPEAPGVEVKPMFGNIAAFVNSNMFMGLFGSDVGVRLSEDQRAELLAVSGSGPFGPADRPMKEYVTLPAHWREDPSTTARWVDQALAHAATLPLKKKR